jgi:hypothetical protein
MADHYRGLTQSLVQLGFLFRRQGEGRWEVWRNRRTDQEVTFDRDEVAKSRAAADAVLTATQAAKPGQPAKPVQSAAAATPTPRKSVPSSKSTPSPKSAPSSKGASKPSGMRATPRKGVKRTTRRKGAR